MENAFYLRSGKSAKDLKELLTGIKSMGSAEYSHHVNSERNDFANWVNDVLKKPQLASRIRQTKSKAELVKVLESEQKPTTKTASARKVSSSKVKKRAAKPVSTKKVAGSKVEKATAKPVSTKKVSKAAKKPSGKVNEILKREEKILEVEQMLEEKIEELNRSRKFRIEEFVQGLVSGAIVGFVIGLFLVSI